MLCYCKIIAVDVKSKSNYAFCFSLFNKQNLGILKIQYLNKSPCVFTGSREQAVTSLFFEEHPNKFCCFGGFVVGCAAVKERSLSARMSSENQICIKSA